MSLQSRINTVPSLFSEGCEADPAGMDNDNHVLAQASASPGVRRTLLPQECVAERATRFGGAMLRALSPGCLAALGPTFDLLWRERAIRAAGLPDPEKALAVPDGLADDLSPVTLERAYSRGLQPRCLMGPATYWAPARRLAQHPGQLRLDNPLRGLLHRGEHDIAFDRDFDMLIARCAQPGPGQTRLSPRLARAFADLFDAGLAPGFEVRDRKDRLAAAGLGVAVGRSFVCERLISPQPGAARLGLAVLARHLDAWGYRMIDATSVGEMVEGMNFLALPRAEYNRKLEANASGGRPGQWRVETQIYAARGAARSVRHLFEPAPQAPAHPTALAAQRDALLDSLNLAEANQIVAQARAKAAMKNPSVPVFSGLSRTP